MHTATASPRLLFVESHLDPITSLTEEAAHWWLVGTQPAKFLSSSAESSVALRSLNLGGARAGNLINPIYISAREALFAILDVFLLLHIVKMAFDPPSVVHTMLQISCNHLVMKELYVFIVCVRPYLYPTCFRKDTTEGR